MPHGDCVVKVENVMITLKEKSGSLYNSHLTILLAGVFYGWIALLQTSIMNPLRKGQIAFYVCEAKTQ